MMDFESAKRIIHRWVDSEDDQDAELAGAAYGFLAYTPGEYPEPKGGKKVAMVGKDPGASALVPWGEEGWEIWGLNDVSYSPPLHAHSRWFQLHNPEYMEKHYPKGIPILNQSWAHYPRGVRLYMDRVYEEYPDSVAFPKAEVDELVQHGWFHASSFDWMIALAVLEGFEEIALYGVSMPPTPMMNGEPSSGLQGLAFWLGVAEGRGVKITMRKCGALLRIVHLAYRIGKEQYGFDREPAFELGDGFRDMR